MNPFQITAEQLGSELLELNRKLTEGFETLARLADIDVGGSEKAVIHREDKARLYQYKSPRDGSADEGRHGVPLLIVYALVNRPYITDLQDGRSLVQGLLNAGQDVYLLDWGYVDDADSHLTLHDYVNRYLDHAVDVIRQRHGLGRINLLGICQGGTLSLCYVATHQHKIANLITSVTPVDFHTRADLLSHLVRYIDVDLCVDALGNVPGEFLNGLFLQLKPYRLTGKKYMDMLDMLDDEEKMALFMRMEKWIFDSPDQAKGAYREFVKGFYQENKLIKGEIKIGANNIDLEKIDIPILNIIARDDHLVPHDASRALAGCISSDDYTEIELPGGHIGIYVGAQAQTSLPLLIHQWLRERSACATSGAG